MNQKKNSYDIDVNDLTFDEEVSEKDLYSKVNVDDRIYVENNSKRFKWLIIIIIVLLLVSFLSALYGFLRLDNIAREGEVSGGVDVLKYNLFVEHSDSSYGGVIKSFSDYSSADKAFAYDFNISNNNPVKLNYTIDIVNPNFGTDNIDMSLINYSLIKNQSEIVSGTLNNASSFDVYSSDILSNVKDEFVIKLWSDKIVDNLEFSFRINIKV